jgi:hypothetical protein
MKGILLSVAAFALYVLITAIVSHLVRFTRHGRFFLVSASFAALSYGLIFWLMPPDLWVIPESWIAHRPWLDFGLGLALLVLNIHNYGDWFFGFNGGFSTSLMLLIARRKERGVTARELIAEYHDSDGCDKIHGWRIPRLVETGYLTQEEGSGKYRLTPKGAQLARVTRLLKRILNLGRGG